MEYTPRERDCSESWPDCAILPYLSTPLVTALEITGETYSQHYFAHICVTGSV